MKFPRPWFLSFVAVVVFSVLSGWAAPAPSPSPSAARKTPVTRNIGDKTAEEVVKLLIAGKSEQVHQQYMAQPRRLDTPLDDFTRTVASANKCIGKVTSFHQITKLDDPVGGYMGIPSVNTVKAEEKKLTYYDTVWQLDSGGDRTYLLVTMIPEGGKPRVLWIQYIGDGIRTAEYQKVEKQVEPIAEQFLGKLVRDERIDIVDHDLSGQFLKRMPRDHVLSMLTDVRHHIGFYGGVHYYSGWVQHLPHPGVTLVFKASPQGSKERYTVLVRLEEDGSEYKVDAVADKGPDLKSK